jgi:acid phosphatase
MVETPVFQKEHDDMTAGIQVTSEGRQFTALPAVVNNLVVWPGDRGMSSGIDTRFAVGLPNGPFRADRYVSLGERTGDLVHRFYQEQEQIDGGKMDRFVAVSGAGALPMGYFDGGSLLLYSLADEYTLADRFFHAAFGGGFLNHFWLIGACTPRYDKAPASLVAQLDENGRWGPGTRVPTIIISPFAKRHFVDHTIYDTTSILKLIETRWHLPSLGDRDAHAGDLTNALQLD